MDPRREVLQMWKHMDRYHTDIGEALIYYRFDPVKSQYDSVYDEGFREYNKGIRMPILWVDQQEAVEDYAPEGRRPTQRVRCAVTARSMHEAGVSVTEVHGNQLTDTSPSQIWRQDRLHDIFYYDNRYWEVSGFQIRGRVKGEDVVIGISGIETFPSDDMVLDFFPQAPSPSLWFENPYGTKLFRVSPPLTKDEDNPGFMIMPNLVEDPPGSGLFVIPTSGGSDG